MTYVKPQTKYPEKLVFPSVVHLSIFVRLLLNFGLILFNALLSHFSKFFSVVTNPSRFILSGLTGSTQLQEIFLPLETPALPTVHFPHFFDSVYMCHNYIKLLQLFYVTSILFLSLLFPFIFFVPYKWCRNLDGLVRTSLVTIRDPPSTRRLRPKFTKNWNVDSKSEQATCMIYNSLRTVYIANGLNGILLFMKLNIEVLRYLFT